MRSYSGSLYDPRLKLPMNRGGWGAQDVQRAPKIAAEPGLELGRGEARPVLVVSTLSPREEQGLSVDRTLFPEVRDDRGLLLFLRHYLHVQRATAVVTDEAICTGSPACLAKQRLERGRRRRDTW